MAFTFELTSHPAPDVVLGAIAHHATYWRESQVPADLRWHGMFGVSARMKYNKFVLVYDTLSNRSSAHFCCATGTVSADTVGGSVVRARIGMRRSAWQSLTWLILPAGLLFEFIGPRPWIALFPIAMGAVYALFLRAEEKSFTPTNALCAHLKSRIESAIAEVSLRSAPAAVEKL